MGAVSFITITTLLAATAFASPAPYLSRRDDGTGAAYVTAMSQCPTLTARSVATPSVHVRAARLHDPGFDFQYRMRVRTTLASSWLLVRVDYFREHFDNV